VSPDLGFDAAALTFSVDYAQLRADMSNFAEAANTMSRRMAGMRQPPLTAEERLGMLIQRSRWAFVPIVCKVFRLQQRLMGQLKKKADHSRH
jgi:hypothetical protein